MCLSCGCGEPEDNHGDPANITLSMMEAAAKAAECSVDQAAHNIVDALHQKGH